MHIEFLVEEASCEELLKNIVPKICGPAVTFNVHPHQGKPDLLQKLKGRLRGYRSWLSEECRIVILVDADDDDCRQLKQALEAEARDAGLITKSAAGMDLGFRF